MALFVAISAAATVTLFLFVALSSRESVFRERLRGLARQDPGEASSDFSIPFLERVLYPLTDTFAEKIISLLPPGLAQRLNNKLIQAGEPMKFAQFLVIWVLVFGCVGIGGT